MQEWTLIHDCSLILRSMIPEANYYFYIMEICTLGMYSEEGGSDHVILPDPVHVLLPVESLSSYSGGITC